VSRIETGWRRCNGSYATAASGFPSSVERVRLLHDPLLSAEHEVSHEDDEEEEETKVR
jgi:hypothetical protein